MKNTPMKKLLVLTLIAIFLLTGAIQSFYTYNVSLNETTSLVNRLYKNQNNYQMKNVSQFLNKIESIATTIKTSQIFYEDLVNTGSLDFDSKLTLNQEMNQFLTELSFSNEEIVGILILHEDLSIYKSPISYGYYNPEAIADSYLLQQLAKETRSGYTETFANDILSNSSFKDVFVYYEKIFKDGMHVATISIVIDSNHIEDVIGDDADDNIIILKTDDSIIYPINPTESMIDLKKNQATSNALHQVTVNGAKYLYTQTLSDNGLQLINLVPMNRISSASAYIYKALLLGFGLSFILFLVLILYFSDTMTKNIRMLINKMSLVGTDAYSKDDSTYLLAEVNSLNDNFHTMHERIINLLQTIHDEQIAINKTKIDLLKAQINPHFIYNTLDTINWLAINNDSTEISEMVADLANMLRYSLNNGRNFTTIDQEINQLRLYLNIQRHKYKNQFMIEEDLDPALLDTFMLNVILQPFVENCLIHGFKNQDSRLTIKLSLKQAGSDTVAFVIEDDGKGCNPTMLNSYVDSDKYGSQGYGIKNISHRLKLYFGDRGMVHYEDANVGTRVLLTFPLIKTVTEEMES